MWNNGIIAVAALALGMSIFTGPGEAAKRQPGPQVTCGRFGCSDWPGAAPAASQGRRAARRAGHRAAIRAPRVGRAAICARVAHSALVASINRQLRKWVRPTGRCGAGETEELMTYYWSGRRTANGERFRPGGMTAAHLTMPFGTRLRVRNPNTGAAVTVRINDRGPCTDASIDLARGAAAALGYRQSGYVCISRMGGSPAYADATR